MDKDNTIEAQEREETQKGNFDYFSDSATEENTGAISNEQAPLEPFQALCYYIEKYKIVNADSNFKVSATKFLELGKEVSIPYLINVKGESTPYRIYPIAAYRIINAAVKTLEKDLEKRVNAKGDKDDKYLSEKTINGIATLADSLFSGAFTHPEGNFLIHRPDPRTGELVLNGHGKNLKQLSSRLQKWKFTLENIKNKEGKAIDLPNLACDQIVKEEIASSYQRWKITRGADFRGVSPLDSSDSIESLKENLGYEPSIVSNTDFYDPSSGVEEEREEREAEIAQANWIGVDFGFDLAYRSTVRGNIISESPKEWIWTYNESPLEYIINYAVDSAKPCLEEAHSLLIQASEEPEKKQIGNFALTLDSKNKINPDSYWKIIKRIITHFPSNRPETDATTKRLDTARFTLSLEAVNRRYGIDEEKFNKAFQLKVYDTVDNGKSATTTRNSLLLETLAEVESTWDKQKREQWLEYLQSYAIGGYENSVAMETERKKLLGRLNHLFKSPREELEKAKNDTNKKAQTIEKLSSVLSSASNAFYEYLSGKTGQMTRRELRTKIQEMKNYAQGIGNTKLLESLNAVSKFVSSISSQIKTGDWYAKEQENKAIIFDFLVTMLETPKEKGKNEFSGSKEPTSKDPLSITIDFISAYAQEKELPTGKTTIEEVLSIWKERQTQDEGSKLADALKKITKNKSETISVIREREKALVGAIEISKKIKESDDPIKAIINEFEMELDVLSLLEEKNTGMLPDPFANPGSPSFESGKTLVGNLNDALNWVEKTTDIINNKALVGKLSYEDTKKAIETRNAATILLSEKFTTNETVAKKERCLDNIVTLKNVVNNRLENILSFWKGVNYIAQNIQSRREEEKFQITPSGKGTLQNIIAITKSRLAEKESKVLKNNKTLGSLRQFQISKTRRRSLLFNVAVPLSLWLSTKEKGTKTKISQDEFIETLEARHKSCKLCLDLENSQENIEEKLHEYREREKEDKYVVNTHILDQCIQMLEDKENLIEGINYINKNTKEVLELQASDKSLDTPNKIFIKKNEQKINSVSKDKKIEESLQIA